MSYQYLLSPYSSSACRFIFEVGNISEEFNNYFHAKYIYIQHFMSYPNIVAIVDFQEGLGPTFYLPSLTTTSKSNS